jgi:L-rhamnose isomerase
MSDDSYEIAKSKYDAIGINKDEELNKLKDIPFPSIHSSLMMSGISTVK